MKRAAMVLALAACASEPEGIAIRPPFSFTAPQVSELQRAMDAWNARTKAEKTIYFGNDGRRIILHRDPCNGLSGELTPDGVVFVKPGTSVYAVALHELGHLLGLGHVAHGVMDPALAITTFSDEDMAKCREAGACP